VDGWSSEWYPDLVYDNHTVEPPATPEEGYYLSADLAEKAIRFVSDAKAVAPQKPWFMYFCPGCAHAPHHVFKDWADRYRGRFDEGYEAIRAGILANQKRIGLLADDVELSPINPHGEPELTGPLPDVPESVSVNIRRRSYTIAAAVVIDTPEAEGVVFAHGGVAGGHSLYIKDAKLHYVYNWLGEKVQAVSSPSQIPTGTHVLTAEFKKTGDDPATHSAVGHAHPLRGHGSGGRRRDHDPAGQLLPDRGRPLRRARQRLGGGRLRRSVPVRRRHDRSRHCRCQRRPLRRPREGGAGLHRPRLSL
jgi:hypothetical protein